MPALSAALVQIAGVVGAVLILVAYLSLQRGWMSASSLLFDSLNMAGSLILFVIAVGQRNAGFMLIEGAWFLISSFEVVKDLRRKAAP